MASPQEYPYAITLMAAILAFTALWAILQPFQFLAPTYAYVGLLGLAPSANIEWNFTTWPDGPMLLSNHHRASGHTLDCMVQFLVSPLYPDQQILIGSHILGRNVLYDTLGRSICYRLFHARPMMAADGSINNVQRFYELVKIVEAYKCASVFPDYDGSQYPGDTTFRFRRGLFTASMFLQRPIIDLCVLEPTPSHQNVHVLISLWTPPKCSVVSHDFESFQTFFESHSTDIVQFTESCEADLKCRLRQAESIRLSCNSNDEQAMCTGKARHRAWARNNGMQYKHLSDTI